jgi:hypothetical protein
MMAYRYIIQAEVLKLVQHALARSKSSCKVLHVKQRPSWGDFRPEAETCQHEVMSEFGGVSLWHAGAEFLEE